MGGRLLPSILLLFSLLICVVTPLDGQPAHTNIVVYVDGFAKWFLNRTNLRLDGFDELRKNGYEADYILPEFPSVPATNYWSIFTGTSAIRRRPSLLASACYNVFMSALILQGVIRTATA